MALSQKQLEAIKSAARSLLNDDFIYAGTIAKAISNAIKAYDEIKDQERKQRIFDAIDDAFDSNGNDDCYVVFKSYSDHQFFVFPSIQDLIVTLSEKFNAFITFGPKIGTVGDLKFAQEVYLLHGDDNGLTTIGRIIGCCDCKTFKKG